MSDGVLQSGNVTPGHLATWTTNGVIADGGPLIGASAVLASLLSADFNTIADQPIVIPASITAFHLSAIYVTNASISLTTAAGGFYPQPAKVGTAIVAAGQVYSALTASTILLQPTIAGAGNNTRFSSVNLPNMAIYFALTTAQGAAAVADIYIIGQNLTA